MSVSHERVKSFVERLERLDEDADAIKNDRKEVLAEAKGEGFDTKILNRVVRLRRIERKRREEEQSILDLYMEAVGEA